MTEPWTATYRLQLHEGFCLRKAAENLEYLARLGVNHVYLSTCLQAAPGSTHGYDVTDPTAQHRYRRAIPHYPCPTALGQTLSPGHLIVRPQHPRRCSRSFQWPSY